MKIGIVSSMPIEIEYILSKCKHVKESMINRSVFYECQYNDYNLVIVATGVGKTNASIYTQILIDKFQPDALISLGVGGSLISTLEPSDIVLGTSFSHHDVRMEQMKNTFPFKTHFKANGELVMHFSKYIEVGKQGKIVSGESFVSDPDKKIKINKVYPQTLVVDMETSSMAQCSFLNEIPFISLIGITDYADDSAIEEFYANDKKVSDNVGKLLLNILKNEKISLKKCNTF